MLNQTMIKIVYKLSYSVIVWKYNYNYINAAERTSKQWPTNLIYIFTVINCMPNLKGNLDLEGEGI